MSLGEINLVERQYPGPFRPAGTALYRTTTIDQTAVGLSYQAILWERVRTQTGIQWVDYRNSAASDSERSTSHERPRLYNASFGVLFPGSSEVYASYVRGMEEAGTAPNSSVNRNEVLPALMAEQRELGFRTAIHRMLLIGAAFEISKPATGFDEVGRFDLFGNVRHRGLELSLSGEPVDGLTVTAGVVALEPRLDGPSVEAGLTSKRPVGVAAIIGQANTSYRIPGPLNVSVDTIITCTARKPGDQLDHFRIPARTQLDLGVRYELQPAERIYVLRTRLQDVMGETGWDVNRGGALMRRQPRPASIQLTAVF